MNQHYSKRFYLAGVLLLLLSGLSLMLVPGCSKSTVAVSSAVPVDEQLAYLNTYFSPSGPKLVPLDSCPVVIRSVISCLTDNRGAIFNLRNGASIILFKIPVGALDKETLITIHATKYKAPLDHSGCSIAVPKAPFSPNHGGDSIGRYRQNQSAVLF
jgi:hypothetical protein